MKILVKRYKKQLFKLDNKNIKWLSEISNCLRIKQIFIFILLIYQQMNQITQFIHSQSFWQWHGFVLSALWLFGSSIGILLKKRSVILHLLAFAIVDYISLFFIAAAIYLVIPKLFVLSKWSLAQRLHVFGGMLFLIVMAYQHIIGVIAWHKSRKSLNHRKLGPRIVIFGRVVAGIGWLIGQQNKNYAIAFIILSIGLYLIAERKVWKIKSN